LNKTQKKQAGGKTGKGRKRPKGESCRIFLSFLPYFFKIAFEFIEKEE
jgi:hypothetical protein